MGERACVYIHDGSTPGVYLYTHWDGPELATTVAQALRCHVRWGDTPYLTRIVFDAMTARGNNWETGYGISSTSLDVNYPLILLDVQPKGGRVSWHGATLAGEPSSELLGKAWTFEEYCRIENPELLRMWFAGCGIEDEQPADPGGVDQPLSGVEAATEVRGDSAIEVYSNWRAWLRRGAPNPPPSGVVLQMICTRCRSILRCLPGECHSDPELRV